MDELFAREVRLSLTEHLDPAPGEHPAWSSSPAAAAVAAPARRHAGPGRYWLLVAAAIVTLTVATAILLAGGLRLPDLPSPPWLLSESPAPTLPDASPGPTPSGDPDVFSWARDDLLDWVTEDELRDAIAVMAIQGTFPPPLDGRITSEIDDGGWEVSFRLVGDSEAWRLGIGNGDHGGRYHGPPTETDPRLPDGVTYEAESGFGYGGYILSGPGSDELLALHLWPPGVEWSDLDANGVDYKTRIFALASMMLLEMGWAEEDSNVFSWARDDLGEWVTADEVADVLAATSMRQPSLAPLDGGVEEDCTRENCSWSFRLVGVPATWSLHAHQHGGAGTWMTDPLLPEGAIHALGWGHFFAGPHSSQSICITFDRQAEEYIGQLDPNGVDYQARYFALASMILRELGWAD